MSVFSVEANSSLEIIEDMAHLSSTYYLIVSDLRKLVGRII